MRDDGSVLTPERESDLSLERLVYFSDAVFAIALTLLALDLPVPSGGSNAALWRSFAGHLNNEYLTFLISFLVISRCWMLHHRFFGGVAAVDRRVVQLDLVYLLWIVVLPFATRVLGADGRYAFGTILYAVVVALVGATFALLVHVCDRHGLVTESGTTTRRIGLGSLAVTAVFLLSIPLAFWSTDGAKYFWLVLAVLPPLLGAGRAPRARREG